MVARKDMQDLIARWDQEQRDPPPPPVESIPAPVLRDLQALDNRREAYNRQQLHNLRTHDDEDAQALYQLLWTHCKGNPDHMLAEFTQLKDGQQQIRNACMAGDYLTALRIFKARHKLS